MGTSGLILVQNCLDHQSRVDSQSVTGIFWVFSQAEIRPHSQWNLGDFFPILKKKKNLQKVFFFNIGILIQSTHGDILLQFNGNSIHV